MENTAMITATYMHGTLELMKPLPFTDGEKVCVTVVPMNQERVIFPVRKGRVLNTLHRRDIYDEVD